MLENPKEKAKSLYGKFFRLIPQTEIIDEVDGIKFSTWDKDQTVKTAKQCALIACDEMISQLADMNNQEVYNVSKYGNYWQLIKQEVENIITPI